MTVRHLRPAFVRQAPVFRAAAVQPANVATEDKYVERTSEEAGLVKPATPKNPQAIALARELYLARRKRGRQLPADLFGEPTWDILLDLYVATCEGRRVPTTSACIGADVPPTTALRWLRILEARGLVEREEDGRDGRRTFVYLTERGLAAMDGFLQGLLTSLRSVLRLPDISTGAEPGLMLND